MILAQDKDTIAAVSTAPGAGGIAVVRVSGSNAVQIVRRLAEFLPAQLESHRLYFGTLKNPEDHESLDEVLVAYFAQGKSVTGEEVIEISCHGGDWLAQEVVRVLRTQGARPARRGEFTYRAFMNGRMDLVQAESVLDLIQSRSQGAARAAIRQLKGLLSKRLEEILDLVTWSAAHLEANIDFAQEDIQTATTTELVGKLDLAVRGIQELLRTESQRRLWDEGYHVALVGLPNVGKSSLLNALIGQDKAIVTDIAGTTRDLVEGFLDIEGVRVRVTDSAGLRESNEVVEKIGIERSRLLVEDADLVLFVSDGGNTADTRQELEQIQPKAKDKIFSIRNKCDQPPMVGADVMLAVSALTGEGIEKLRCLIAEKVKAQTIDDSPVIIKARHGELLRKALVSLQKSNELLAQDASPEFAAFELKEAVLALHEILGQRFDDQVMDRVFNEFCLGK